MRFLTDLDEVKIQLPTGKLLMSIVVKPGGFYNMSENVSHLHEMHQDDGTLLIFVRHSMAHARAFLQVIHFCLASLEGDVVPLHFSADRNIGLGRSRSSPF